MFEGVTLVASVSGGKDSAALSLWLTEQGLEHQRIFADTGWEAKQTYEYLETELADALGPILVLRGQRTMPELIRHKGMFPSRLRRFCTQQLKVRPIQKYLKSLTRPIVNVVGIRAAESASRAKMPEWEYDKLLGCDVWRPLINWSEQEVIDIHTRHGLRPNPLYLKGASRVGCWPCIYARKAEIRLVAELDPERIELIRQLEEQVEARARQRYIDEGTTMEEKGYHAPTFFHTKSHANDKKGMLPIDEAVAWARTSHGGRQVLLFDPEPPGCMRWGLCESVA